MKEYQFEQTSHDQHAIEVIGFDEILGLRPESERASGIPNNQIRYSRTDFQALFNHVRNQK